MLRNDTWVSGYHDLSGARASRLQVIEVAHAPNHGEEKQNMLAPEVAGVADQEGTRTKGPLLRDP